MFTQSQFQTLFAYHWHTTRQLMDCAAQLTDDDYHAPSDYGHGSIHDLLFHLLRADQGWRRGLETGRQLAGLSKDDCPDLASLRRGFESEQTAWQTVLEGLTEQQLAANVDLVTFRGDNATFILWRILQHLILHGMQHHAELAQMLTARGQSPGNIDFLFYGE